MADTVKVEFTQNAQVRGRGYYRGQTAELDPRTAQAYIDVGQAKLFQVDEPRAARQTADRGGKPAETAAREAPRKKAPKKKSVKKTSKKKR